MSKAVLISIQPKWLELIEKGKKTVEVRKTRPKMEPPFKCYLYCTKGDSSTAEDDFTVYTPPHYIPVKGNGKVVGEALCDAIYPIAYTRDGFADKVDCETTCMSPGDFLAYGGGEPLYGWNLCGVKIYDRPKYISEFRRPCVNDLHCESCAMFFENNGTCGNGALRIKRAPQSWCYVEK